MLVPPAPGGPQSTNLPLQQGKNHQTPLPRHLCGHTRVLIDELSSKMLK